MFCCVDQGETTVLTRFGVRIKELRLQKNLTQQELADSCDVDIRTVQRIEKGEVSLGIEIMFLMAKAFDLNASQLLEGID